MKRKHLAAAVALAATLGFLSAVLMPIPAEAIPECGWHVKHYSDPGHTNLIGERWVTPKDCGCYLSGWGHYGGYYVLVNEPVCIEV